MRDVILDRICDLIDDGKVHPVAEHRLDGRFVLKLYPLPHGRHRAQTRVMRQGLV